MGRIEKVSSEARSPWCAMSPWTVLGACRLFIGWGGGALMLNREIKLQRVGPEHGSDLVCSLGGHPPTAIIHHHVSSYTLDYSHPGRHHDSAITATTWPQLTLLSSPSTVVYMLPRVPISITSSSCGSSSTAVSDLSTSLRKSSLETASRVYTVPFGGIAPPPLT